MERIQGCWDVAEVGPYLAVSCEEARMEERVVLAPRILAFLECLLQAITGVPDPLQARLLVAKVILSNHSLLLDLLLQLAERLRLVVQVQRALEEALRVVAQCLERGNLCFCHGKLGVGDFHRGVRLLHDNSDALGVFIRPALAPLSDNRLLFADLGLGQSLLLLYPGKFILQRGE
ncbi:hypothetical protein N7462_010582 [Penicillium macrosclerotiorum]|uniref:uncharacterized protein n=1 Tax=Penicillium macrosclerotiorum TaxID=303699 RepID=UPI002546C510|nr:uncharacterized protein N7462_010582 [Penicillium macrosclerotiorum]KAJ5669512.1 hypothetical protein N7462_010582 [Penicillium macrosclerotiorum]